MQTKEKGSLLASPNLNSLIISLFLVCLISSCTNHLYFKNRGYDAVDLTDIIEISHDTQVVFDTLSINIQLLVREINKSKGSCVVVSYGAMTSNSLKKADMYSFMVYEALVNYGVNEEKLTFSFYYNPYFPKDLSNNKMKIQIYLRHKRQIMSTVRA